MVLLAVLCTACVPWPSSWRRESVTPSSTQPVLPRIPRDAPRFEIDSVTDSTATFRVQEARWIREGMATYAVDPLQRDALVARLRVVSRDSLTATALITSQVAGVKRDHFLLVMPPVTPWWKTRHFWVGTLLGLTVGAGGVAVAR